jgi:phenylpropionate dioxygenase-like ring-hydroxylating dioxygenase large terminal subunit
MYINFWYPIAKSEDVVTYEPHRAQVLGQKLVAFRDTDGAAHVLSDVCIHRGAALGKGWVKGNAVVCPYHGWQFAGDGKCTHIPTLDDDKVPVRAKVDSYPVQEKYGIVFAFLGDLPEEERPPICEIKEYDQEGWRANRLVVFELKAFYERSIENGLDPSHNEFVHPAQGLPGMQPDFRKKPLDMHDRPWGSEFVVRFVNPISDARALMNEAKAVPEVTAGSGYVGPNQMITWIRLSEEQVFHQYFFEAPIDESHTRIFFVNMRTFMLEPENDGRLVNINLTIAQEDIDLLETLDPVGTPNSPTEEVLVPSDGAVVSYRQHLKTWKDHGWRIDSEMLRAQRQNKAFAIPCPGRRTSGNWVLNPVPLVPTVEEKKAATG